MDLDGYLDRIEPGRIAGWVRHRTDIGRRLTLDVYIGTRLIGTVLAANFRQDLLDAGKGDGHCAFNFVPPQPLRADEMEGLILRVAGSAQMFTIGGRGLFQLALPPNPAPQAGARRFRRCILHIGTEKTGSTTLQVFLQANRDTLAQAGYFLPRSLVWPPDAEGCPCWAMVGYARDDGAYSDQVRQAAGVNDAASLADWRTRLAAAFAAELAAAPAQCDTLLISSEHCHSRLVWPHEVAAVRQLLEPFCDSFEVVAYLRVQHELAASAYGMFLRDGLSDVVMFPDYTRPRNDRSMPRNYFDYFAMLSRWAAVFGRERVQPVLFTPATLRNGDVVDDFLARIGAPAAGWTRPARQNTTIPPASHRFLQGMSRAMEGRPRAEIDRVRAWMIPRLEAVTAGRGALPARGAVAAFMAQFAGRNEALRQIWFPDRPALFDDDLARFPEAPDPAADAPAEFYELLIAMVLA